MAESEVIQLNAHFMHWQKHRGSGLKGVEPFLYYVCEQLLKPFNLSDEEIQYGITDKGNDGGVDAFYLFANKNTLVRDNIDLAKSGTAKLRLIVIQSKSSTGETGFKPLDILKFRTFTDDLFAFSKKGKDLNHKYQPHLLSLMDTFKEKYIEIASNLPNIEINYYIVTRGDEEKVSQAATDEIEALKLCVNARMPDSSCSVNAVATQELLSFVRKRKTIVKTLKWAEQAPLAVDNQYVGLVRLVDYVNFLKLEDGTLNELIFESNVRGYQQNTQINKEMRKTLAEPGNLNFWLLNNGVTVISEGEVKPQPNSQLSIEDPQVVNGLQTSREIFRADILSQDPRLVLVKVLRVDNDRDRDDIIRATNSQNKMASASLRGTDLIQQQIEVLFKNFGLFYDRRKGYYKDRGEPIAQIVSAIELVQAVVSTVERRPDSARARPSDYINKDVEYLKIFGTNNLPLSVFLRSVQISRVCEGYLLSRDIDKGNITNLKHYLSYSLVCDIVGKRYPSAEEIRDIDLSLITAKQLNECFLAVNKPYTSLAGAVNHDTVAKGTQLLDAINNALSLKYNDKKPPKAKPKKLKIKDTLRQNNLI